MVDLDVERCPIDSCSLDSLGSLRAVKLQNILFTWMAIVDLGGQLFSEGNGS